MFKEYLDVSKQVDLLCERGLACDDQTQSILMREGYYAVINGYGKPFLDEQASRASGEDRYAKGAAFEHVYALFRFDRELRMLTFGELTRVEGMLRSLVSTSFLEVHSNPDDYLDKDSYSSPRHYVLGERSFDRNLQQTITTLSRYAYDHEHDERGRDDVRLAHYRDNYDSVPLWVVFSDFSYGNLFHFLALMKKNEQVRVAERLVQVLGGSSQRTVPSRRALVNDVDFQVDVRNICAHGERLYDARMGYGGKLTYADFVQMMRRFLTDEDYASYARALEDLLDRFGGVSSRLDRVLAATRIRENL